MEILHEAANRFSPTDFMRARRPELYSDTMVMEEPVLERSQFEFHLDSLTQRKEEIRFEHFCRRLAEKELCPNLLTQTGPTGGGDSKVDAETFPVADTIAERWYEGDPMRAASERWAFAFSAKKKWRPKVEDDVRKIVETGRNYSLIYFMTNQAVRDRDRAAVEDALGRQWGVEVRILDRSWIVDKVEQHNRWDVVFQTLAIERPRVEFRTMPGPIDVERQHEIEELDRLIEDSTRYQGSEYQLVEDCLQTALLARGLGRPRVEVDGRFDRSERIARNRGDDRQLFRILYHRAWTANWWYDDFAELDRLYKMAEPLVIESEWVWDLEKLVNLWQVETAWKQIEGTLHTDENWAIYTTKLREALLRHASNSAKPTSALWARTELAFMDLTDAASKRELLPSVLVIIRGILKEAKNHIDYPMEPLVRIVEELGRIAGGDENYDKLMEEVIQFQAERVGKAEAGRIRLDRGFQKLDAGKSYDAIDQFAKAQHLLALDEHKGEYLLALTGTALGYEKAGLLWAARANLVAALDRSLYEYFREGRIAPQALPLLRKLVWVELQLGRVPCVLAWIELLGTISHAVELDKVDQQKLEDEYQLMDAVLGILVLRSRWADWSNLNRVAGLLDRFSLVMSRAAALFSLGYEELLRSEYGLRDDDLDHFFSLWLKQPATDDLPIEAEWHLDQTVTMRTVIMGCEIEMVAENHTPSILLGEAILALLESFLSTAVRLKGHYSARSCLKVEIRRSESADTPFTHTVQEDDCGESHILVLHPRLPPTGMVRDSGYGDALFRLLAELLPQLQVPFSSESLEGLFANDRAPDRAFLAAQSPLFLTNLLGEYPKYHVLDWVDESLIESLPPLRAEPWAGPPQAIASVDEKETVPLTFEEGPPPEELFGIDSLKHRDMRVLTPINMILWDKAHWRGLGVAIWPGNPAMPELILMFEDLETGEKIFRGWRKRIGDVDRDEWIGLTLITGIDRHHPNYYRLAISVNEAYVRSKMGTQRHFALVFRMQTMTPADSTNLDRFLYLFEKAGRYRLAPGLLAPSQPMPPHTSELSIEKRQLRVVPAWQIGPNDPACAALKEIDDPLIPSDVDDPPVLRTLRQYFASDRIGTSSSS